MNTGTLKEDKMKPLKLWKRLLPVAASIAVVCGLGYLYKNSTKNPVTPVIVADVNPGYNKAVIKLSDGRIVNLSNQQKGVKVNGNNVAYFDGTTAAAEKDAANQPTGDNTIMTPKGGQYQVVLPDGTQVWLNADSKLKYPAVFAKTKRLVTLEGEAYFEVQKYNDPKGKHLPFVVKTKQQEILVLGTGFNVNAYPDDAYTKTSLVHGHVQVQSFYKGSSNQKQGDLMPGQEAVVSNTELLVRNADVEAASSWRNGYFSFENKPIRQVLKEIERWYNVQVIYEGPIPEVEFYGGLYRSNKLSAVIKVLKASGIDARLEKENHLVVKKLKE